MIQVTRCGVSKLECRDGAVDEVTDLWKISPECPKSKCKGPETGQRAAVLGSEVR